MMAVASFRKKTTAKSKRDRCDQIFRRLIRERDQVCQAQGLWGVECWEESEAAHFHPRRHLETRFEPDNAVYLCIPHHRYMDTHESTKWSFAAARLGSERLGRLETLIDAGWDKNWTRVLTELLARLNGEGDVA